MNTTHHAPISNIGRKYRNTYKSQPATAHYLCIQNKNKFDMKSKEISRKNSGKTGRRTFLKWVALLPALIGGRSYIRGAGVKEKEEASGTKAAAEELSKVYMSRQITSDAMLALYAAAGRSLTGRVAVKVHTGESEASNHLRPGFIKDLVQRVNGTIVECNTAYGGSRTNAADHLRVVAERGFTAIAPVDILDAEGEISLPFPNGKHITEDFVGSHIANYDSLLVLTHFKGHAMGGFGGALKNISIGMASTSGKCWIHSGGNSRTSPWGGAQNPFLESMAEASGAVMNRMGENIVYINVMNNLSVDCDCSGRPAAPELEDIGILASLDPVALDKACVDHIYAADARRSASLRRRIEGQNGTLVLTHAESLGLGSRQYELVMLEDNPSGNEPLPKADDYRVYLSPEGDNLNVSGDFSQLTLINMNGATVARTNGNSLQTGAFPAGIYLLKIDAGNRAVTRKIWKK
jgi:uncharacterized Fe-S center protein